MNNATSAERRKGEQPAESRTARAVVTSTNGLGKWGIPLALAVLILVFQIVTNGKVLTATNAMNLLNGNSYVLVMAVGMLFVILLGQIDLAPGSVAAVVGICVALSIQNWSIPWWAGVLVGLGIGVVIGSWQGAWVAWGIPGFIVTLAGQMLFRGLNQFIGKSQTIPVPSQIQWIGGGYLPEWGPDTGFNNSTLLLGIVAAAVVIAFEVRKWRTAAKSGRSARVPIGRIVQLVAIVAVIGYATFLFGTGRPGTSFPIPGVILAIIVIVYNFIANHTTLGRSFYAVGGNRQAAALTGINTKLVYFLAMLNMSLLAAVAAIMFIGRATASGPFDGTGWELDAIAAVFIGGAAIAGGVGTVTASIIGGLMMAVLNNGLQLLGVGSDVTQMIKGLVLILAVAFDFYNKQQHRFSIIGRLFPGKQHVAAAKKPGLAAEQQ